MTSGDIQSILSREFCGFSQPPQFVRRVSRSFTVNTARAECRFRVSRGTQLHLLRADVMRGLDLFRIRIDEQARENFSLSQLRNGRPHDRDVCLEAAPASGGGSALK